MAVTTIAANSNRMFVSNMSRSFFQPVAPIVAVPAIGNDAMQEVTTIDADSKRTSGEDRTHLDLATYVIPKKRKPRDDNEN